MGLRKGICDDSDLRDKEMKRAMMFDAFLREFVYYEHVLVSSKKCLFQ